MKIAQFYHNNQFIIYNNDETIFQSYNSTIAIYDNETLRLGRDWDYSKTTLRHLYLFINAYTDLKNINCKKDIEKAIKNNIIIYDDNLV